VYGFVAGLGGKDVTYEDLEDMAKKVIRQEASEVEWWKWDETGGG